MKLKRISMLLLFTAVLVFSGLVCNANYNLTAASGVYTLTVETGKNSYDRGEPVDVTVKLLEDGAVYASNVSVGLVLMKGDSAVAFEQTKNRNDEGSYAWRFSTNNLEPGEYKVVATVNVASAEASFTIQEKTVPASYKLTLGTDRKEYSPDQAVEVSGSLVKENGSQTSVPGVAIGLVLYLGEETVAFAQKTTDAEGAFTWTIPASTLEPGDYRVYATANVVKAEAAFRVSLQQVAKPEIELYKPAKGANSVAVDAEISATFNMDVTSVDLSELKLKVTARP